MTPKRAIVKVRLPPATLKKVQVIAAAREFDTLAAACLRLIEIGITTYIPKTIKQERVSYDFETTQTQSQV